ncbi:hypothetical protein QFC19_001170 [Naganishia cerealis]|uniref:Uncharacterized protein n=1 Tax=Naganishia cerealis TaxID=610337 RepID=A0ACC2WKQ5_9TREE|nr:hypothetical protein QFC19_001170 [Naganishia cerealis]
MTARTSARKAAAAATTIQSAPPPPAAPVIASSGMTRRSKRVVESESPDVEPEAADPIEDNDGDGNGDVDAEGEIDIDEDEEGRGSPNMSCYELALTLFRALLKGEDMDIDEEYRVEAEPSVTPAETPTSTTPVAPSTSGIKIKLTLNNKNKEASSSSSTATNIEAGPSNVRTGTRSKRTAAQAKADAAFEDDTSQASVGTNKGKSSKPSKKVKLDISDKEASDGEEAMGGMDPSRLTARQRARQGAGGLGEHLMMLPEGKARYPLISYVQQWRPVAYIIMISLCIPIDSGKKIILSDLEKQRKKEENARRRKLQQDQKMENDRNDVINRLLKAQTGKTRRNAAQAEGTPIPGLDGDETVNGTATGGSAFAPLVPGMLRFVSSIKSGTFEMSVSAPDGKDQVLQFEESQYHSRPRDEPEKRTNICSISGCSLPIRYRLPSSFNVGGCSLDHYRSLNLGQNKVDS